MSTPPGPLTAAQQYQYKCPHCGTEKFKLQVLSAASALQFMLKGQVVTLAAVQSIIACEACKNVLSVQFIPMEVEDLRVPAAGDATPPPKPPLIHFPGGSN
jgi:hypothetical protein